MTTNITVIGLGPRGLSVLERLLKHSDRLENGERLHIDVIDPGEPGQGSHPERQPDHLLINTLASQVTMFAADSPNYGLSLPTLVEWVKAKGYRRFGRRFFSVGDESGAEITEFDYLPRCMLGEYLAWVYHFVAERLRERVSIFHHRTRANDVVPNGRSFHVHLANGHVVHADYLFLTMGHGRRRPTDDDWRMETFVDQYIDRNPALAFFQSPYPVDTLSSISSSSTVAIQGFGLTAHDVISELTVGRGGRFVGSDDDLRYEPSGREPKLLLFSRNCLPFAARGINQKGLTGRHQAQFFTPAAVRHLIEQKIAETGERRIDFRADVLPLILTEMAYAYRCAASRSFVDPQTFVATTEEAQVIEAILWPLKNRSFGSDADFQAFFDGYFREDLSQAYLGNLTSPVKAATDVLRDTREALRTAIEYGAATPESHRFFCEEFNPIANRVSFGPPKQRNVEFNALRKVGLLELGGGPGARVYADPDRACFRIDTAYPDGDTHRFADVLITARLDPWSPETDDSPLTANLVKRGLIRPYRNGDYHPGGIDIDRRHRPIGRDGKTASNIWVIGFPVEGPHFYTHALPRAQIASRQTTDAECCVLQLLDALAQNDSPTREIDTDHSTGDLKATA